MIIVYYDIDGNPYTKIDSNNIDEILNNKHSISWFLEN
jgi:hypothetical protein